MNEVTTRTLWGLDRRLLLGILFICGSGVVFPIMNGFAKALGSEYPLLQVSWARAFGHVVFLLCAFLPRYGLQVLRTRRPLAQLARSSLLTVSNLCFFFAITFIPIAEAASISQTAPLIVALLAGPMLAERTTLARVLALLVGFAGVVIVIRPGTAVFHWASLLVLVSATCFGLYSIVTRRIAAIDSPETSAVLSSVIGALGMLAVLPFVWKTPHGIATITMFCGMGVLGALGHYCVANALKLAPASIVAPFQYFQLIGSVIVGYVGFGDLPDALTWVGATIIVASGLWLGWSQTRKKGEGGTA